jgi:hypothetical protein
LNTERTSRWRAGLYSDWRFIEPRIA